LFRSACNRLGRGAHFPLHRRRFKPGEVLGPDLRHRLAAARAVRVALAIVWRVVPRPPSLGELAELGARPDLDIGGEEAADEVGVDGFLTLSAALPPERLVAACRRAFSTASASPKSRSMSNDSAGWVKVVIGILRAGV
jgi:hypothetical protein